MDKSLAEYYRTQIVAMRAVDTRDYDVNDVIEFNPNNKFDWIRDPLCQSIGTDMFFATKQEPYQTTYAKKICRECHLIDACLEYAIRYERHGVWGGMTAAERARHRSARGIKFKGDNSAH